MKINIICGGDRLGKNSIIENLCKHYNYDNVHVRHLGKPPKELTKFDAFQFQKDAFEKEGKIINTLYKLDCNKCYFENILLFNRFIYGEYVYGHMFRSLDKDVIMEYLYTYERRYLLNKHVNLIMLTADPEFFLSKEDGNSFSKNLEQKTKELELFKEVFDKSLIPKKYMIKVNEGNQYKSKETIFNNILNFIQNE